MTEAEWLACADSLRMVPALGRAASARKLRLFACACCRRAWDSLPDERNRKLVAVVEERPDANREDPVLWAAIVASSQGEHEHGGNPLYWAAKYLGRTYYKTDPLTGAMAVLTKVAPAGPGGRSSFPAERAEQARLLRCVFGNPFRPVALDPAWLDWNNGTVAKMAELIYTERGWDKLAILADALEEAGCSDAAILTHCRAPGPHVRGCWAVDLLLGKT